MIKLDCGCTIDQNFTVDKLNEHCPKVWELLSKGLTYGIYQLESSLGRTWTKKLKPNCVADLAALGATLRPGALKCVDENNISVTEHFCRRKNKEEIVPKFDPIVDNVLKDTYGLNIYQESSIKLGQDVAGFTLEESDSYIRKGIGKKVPEIIAECKKLFLSKAKELNSVPYNKAEIIFDGIEKSQRYQFNKSHAVSYGNISFITAWLKAHFPIEFFMCWLQMAKEKQDTQDEVKNLINEAKLMGINTYTPNLTHKKIDFYHSGNNLYFGIGNIKGIGQSQISTIMSKISELEKEYCELNQVSWYTLLTELLYYINKTVVNNLIKTGALDYIGLSRQKMLHDFSTIQDITDREINLIKQSSVNNLIDALKFLDDKVNVKRRTVISSLVSFSELNQDKKDDIVWLASQERELLGISLSCSPSDIMLDVACNCSCAEFMAGKSGKCVLSVNLDGVREWQTKDGKQMAFLSVYDETGKMDDVIIFSEAWEKYKDKILMSDTIIMNGFRSKKGTFILNQIL